MCGITGIFAFNSVGRINLVHLEAATRRLEKRGPDVHNTWFDEVAGLGHRRLSIIDTSAAGNQPMKDVSGRYHIVFNGEIYNYKHLRTELQNEGCVFHSDSDTEVLLQAYIRWGQEVLPRLNGFFAFAIYDQEEESLFLARDRFGIKPLVYHVDGDRLLFASELKALMAYGLDKQINREALHLFFQLTYIPAPLSILEGVKKLLPGHYMMIQHGAVEIKKFYEFPYREAPPIRGLAEAKQQLITTLRKAVTDRLVADVPLGAFLSGGIDSSVIVALASEEVKDLKTYSIGFKDNKYFDETHYAQLVADKFQTDHHVFSLTNDDLLAEVQNVVDYIDEPFGDSSALPVFILSKETRKHVTVALSGDGADEIFSGYNKHSAWLMSQQTSARNSLIASLGGLWEKLPKSRNHKVTDTIRQLHRFASAQKMTLRERYWFLASFTNDLQIGRLLKSDYQTDHMSFKNNLLQLMRVGELNEVLALDSQLVLQGDMLPKVDMMSMANGLEVRVPFLDPAVVEMAFSMHTDLKATSAGRKIVLREAFREVLPEELYQRPKHGFEVPLLDWFKGALKGELEKKVFNREKVEAQAIFDWNEIARIKKKLYSFDPGDTHILVWCLFVFQNWYHRYFND
ncbi:asparagine synthase (glutamine-hydrolyzing) [Marinoscillum luteum]|uniref:asparagine synthase (glutamine-hydrolyzing) n=1 Tax=Marinoscillum luteum TaxID=861051 RepID=A0ABW7NBT8_9BACT